MPIGVLSSYVCFGLLQTYDTPHMMKAFGILKTFIM